MQWSLKWGIQSRIAEESRCERLIEVPTGAKQVAGNASSAVEEKLS